jgi:hypothetical protein
MPGLLQRPPRDRRGAERLLQHERRYARCSGCLSMSSKKPVKVPSPAPRRDATGHVKARYAADPPARNRARAEPLDPEAFTDEAIRDDSLAEQLGEQFVRSATSGEDETQDILDAESAEERGGPFIESTSAQEFAYDTDGSNPEDATREPFPRSGPGP